MNCSVAREKLSCYIDGMLDEQCLELLEEHLKRCADCRHELATLRSVADLLCEVELVEPPANMRSSIWHAVAMLQQKSLSCQNAADLLSAYMDGELTASENRAVAEQLRSCVFCMDNLTVLDAIKRAAQSVKPIAPPTSLRERIETAIQGRRVPVWGRILSGVNGLAGQAARSIALGAVLLGVLYLSLSSFNNQQSHPTRIVLEKHVSSEPKAPARSEPGRTTIMVRAPQPAKQVLVAQKSRQYKARRIRKVRATENVALAPAPPETTPKMKKVPDVKAEPGASMEENSVALAQDEPKVKPDDVATPEPTALAEDRPKTTDKETVLKVAVAGVADDDRIQELLNQAKAEAAMRRVSRSGGVSFVSIKF